MSDAAQAGTFRWGLVGYGDLAEKRVADALRQSGNLRAVWGRNFDRTKDFALRHKIPHACTSFEELLRGDIDAVYVCTPPDSHAQYTIASAQAGKHVLVEKPMASSHEDCTAMLRAAADAKITLGVAYYRRAFPKMIRIRELITQGVLGVPVWAHIASHSWFAPAPDDPKSWRVKKRLSGGAGALADIGVHRLDLLDYWLPGADVKNALFTNLVNHYEVEDGSSLLMQLPNGAPVQAFFSWNSKTWVDRFEMVGSEGKILVEPLDGPHLTVIRGREREEITVPPPENAHAPCVQDFVSACLTGRPPLCDGGAGARVNRLLEESIRLARRS